MGVAHHGKPAESIGNCIILYFDIKDIHPKLLY